MADEKDKKIAFLSGVIVGIFAAFIFLGGMYGVYKVAKKIGKKLLSSPQSAFHQSAVKSVQTVHTKPTGQSNIFSLNFEKKEDLNFFELKDGLYAEQSEEFITEGKFSLLLEYPAGASFPGLSWEVFRKDQCLNWNNAGSFRFDVYNNSEKQGVLIVKLKSGGNYPKNKYQSTIPLAPQAATEVSVSISELKKYLDVSQISYINIFMSHPASTYVLYFDNMRVE